MTEAPADWALVGRRLTSRIRDLKLSKIEVIRLSGVSDKTLTRYLAGEPIVRPDKERSLCRALGWSDDSIERILRGEEPVVVDQPVDPGPEPRVPNLAARIAELERWRAKWEPVIELLDAESRAKRADARYRAKLSQLAERSESPQPAEEAAGPQRERRGA